MELQWQSELLDQAFDPMLSWELTGGITYWNKAAEELYGYAASEAVGRVSSELLQTEFPGGRKMCLDELGRRGFWIGELLQRAKDGRRIAVDGAFKIVTRSGVGRYVLETNRDITEKKRLAEEFRRNEKRLRTILDSEPECVKLLAADSALLEINPAGLRMLEADSLEQVRSQSVVPFVVEKDRESFRELIGRVFRGEPGTLEFQMIGLKGGRLWLETHATPLRDENGSIAALLGITRDITERKRAEKAARQSEERLRHSEALLRSVVNTSPHLLFFVKDRESRIVLANQALARFYGLQVEELLGRLQSELHASQGGRPEEIEKWLADDRHVIDSGEPLEMEETGTDRNGRLHYFQAGKYPLELQDGRRGVLVLSQDITERKQAEESLRRSEEHLSALMNSVDGIVWEADTRNVQFTFVNPQAERLLGYPLSHWLEQPDFWTAHLHPDDRGHTVQQCAQHTWEKRDHELEYRMIAADGRAVWLRDIVTVVVENDKPVKLRGIMVDITERKQLERQLQQSQKMEAVGQLAGGVAHDFNNLLTVILGYGEMMRSTMEPVDPNREGLEIMLEAGERAASLTRQLLAFSRRTVLEPKVLDLNAVVHETERMLRWLIGENIRLASQLDPDIACVRVDPGQLSQVLMNLAVNARDAMPRGGLLTFATRNVEFDEAYCRTHTYAKPGPFVQLSISDTGLGMTPEVKSRIFEPFFTTKEVGKGTGLGLSVAYGIIKQSDGFIEVYSEPNRGTTFKLYLPAVTQEIARCEVPSAAMVRNGSETILLVEDEAAVRNVALLSLQMHGYTVLPAADGENALRIIEEHQGNIDLLLTDLVMPGISGRELAESLQPRFSTMKILFMSGYTADAVVRNGLAEERMAFVQKPFSPATLAKKVREVLDEGN